MNSEKFVRKVAKLEFANCFNPYSSRCDVHDVPDAPQLRSETLRLMLDAARNMEIESMWVGRDLGYRGGRRTGLALTDDYHVENHLRRFGVSVSSPTTGEVISERTAAVIWNLLDRIEAPIFLWNVFPLHPHEPAAPFSNRAHNATERRAGEELLKELIQILKPKTIIAIGNDAATVVEKLGGNEELEKVRHPSYGGQSVFLRQMSEHYGLD
ncbi:MAG: uracil-DNA glycosylase [marine bacterium B5-7]|nr:MAG: uracil-DNA glycosylase [marine bacterium B5-7]